MGHPLPQGAAELVLKRCTSVMTSDGEVVPLTEADHEAMGLCVTAMASQGLRTLCLSFRDLSAAQQEAYHSAQGAAQRACAADEQLTACCIVGIKVGLTTALS